MKILITSDWYYPTINGVVRSVLNLRNMLMEMGHEVRVLTLEQHKGQADETEQAEHQGVYFFRSFSAHRIYPQARILQKYDRNLIREIADWHPDVIHTQCEFSSFLLAKRVAARLDSAVPILHTYHTVYEDYTHYFFPNARVGRCLVRHLTKAVLKKVDGVIAPTEKVTALLQDYGVSCPVYTVPSGIDTRRYEQQIQEERRTEIRNQYGIPQEAVVLTFVGRMAKEKNVGELIAYAEPVLGPDVYLFLVGGGPLLEEIQVLAGESPKAGYIRFSGMVSPDVVHEYYQTGDIFLSASTSETQGLTYIEALANGLPALCRKDPCLADVITEGINGFQYETREQFLQGFDSLLALSAEERRQRARSSVRKFSMEVFAQQVFVLYERMLEQQQSSHSGTSGSLA